MQPDKSIFALTGPIFPGQVHGVQLDLGFLCSMTQNVLLRSLTTKRRKTFGQ